MKIGKMTMSILDMPAMVAFYNGVFACNLTPIENTPFYQGNLAGINVLFCPNEIAQVDANRNRHQFDILVDDVDAVAAKVTELGGRLYDDRQESESSVAWGLDDPDGNSLVLISQR